MDILAVQQRVLDAGWWYSEQIDPIGDPQYFITIARRGSGRDATWFIHPVRHDAWKRIAEWLDKREAGE